MSTTTTNYNFVKPAASDPADVTVMNPNWDAVDTKMKALETTSTTHTSNKNNPHAVTKTQLGLGNVDNTSDADKPISTRMQTALDKKLDGTTLTGGRVLVSSTSGKVATSSITTDELQQLSGAKSILQTQIENKYSKNGGDLYGAVNIKNTDEFRGITKTRTISDKDYQTIFGCGLVAGEGCVALELQAPEGVNGANVVIGRLEIRRQGVAFVDANNARHYIYSSGIQSASVE